MIRYIVKRSGDKVSFDARKIKSAIFKANTRIAAERMSDADLNELTEEVLTALEKLPEQIDEMLKHKEKSFLPPITPKRRTLTSIIARSTSTCAKWTTSS